MSETKDPEAPQESASERADRLARRVTFDAVALLYDGVRHPYPEALIDALATFAGLGQESRVLEVGSGTGQLTLGLARRGMFITGVELGPNLATRLRARLEGFDRCRIVVADFDTWPLPPENFDVVVAANAYHWLEPRTRLKKCVDALRPGGTLAIIEGRSTAGRDRFFVESQACYARWYPDHQADFDPDAGSKRNVELEESGYFDRVHVETVAAERHYTAAEYREHASAFSDVRALDEASREGFLQCIEDLIVSRFDGRIARAHAYYGYFARKASSNCR